mgnify:CR=1 FL=1
MSEKRSCLQFLIGILMPILLIVVGAALAALGFTQGWPFLVWTGLIVAGVGLLWGTVLVLMHGPLEWLE